MPRPHSNPAGTTISAEKVPKDGAKNNVTSGSKSSEDLLGLGLDFSSSPTTEAQSVTATPIVEEDPFDAFVSATRSTNAAAAPLTLAEEESDFFNQKVTDKKMDKDSILKMFDSSSNFISPNPTAAFGSAPHSTTGLHSLNNNFFQAPAANLVPHASLLQNGSGQQSVPNQQVSPFFVFTSVIRVTDPHFPQQAMFNSATNPFLASGPTISNANLFQDLSSLSLGSAATSNWMTGTAAAAPQRPAAASDLINPFTTSSMSAPTPAAPMPLFADFGQGMSVKSESPAQSLNWAFPTARPIEAKHSLPPSDLWQ